MATVRLNKNLSRDVAVAFGPQITRSEARKVMARAQRIATSAAIGRNPGHSVADRISFELHYGGVDTDVVMTVINRNGDNVSLAHEFGAYNVQAKKFVSGHHVMQRAAGG